MLKLFQRVTFPQKTTNSTKKTFLIFRLPHVVLTSPTLNTSSISIFPLTSTNTFTGSVVPAAWATSVSLLPSLTRRTGTWPRTWSSLWLNQTRYKIFFNLLVPSWSRYKVALIVGLIKNLSHEYNVLKVLCYSNDGLNILRDYIGDLNY